MNENENGRYDAAGLLRSRRLRAERSFQPPTAASAMETRQKPKLTEFVFVSERRPE